MKNNKDQVEKELAELETIWDSLSPAERKTVFEYTLGEVLHKQTRSKVIRVIILVGAIYIILSILYILLK